MTVVLISTIKRFQGLAADVKPTDAPAGSTFYTVDTGDWLVWDGDSWEAYTFPLLDAISPELPSTDEKAAMNAADSPDASNPFVTQSALGTLVQSATVTLEDEDIKALPQTHFEIVPAPGAGKMLLLIGGMAQLNVPTTAYTLALGASEPQIGVCYESVVGYLASAYINQGDMLTNGGVYMTPIAPKLIRGVAGDYTNVISTTQVGVTEDQAFSLKDDDNDGGDPYEGGDPANTLTITVFYIVVDLP